MTNSLSVEVVAPSDKNHGAIAKTVGSARRAVVDYDKIATAYNNAEVGAIVLVHLPEGYRLSNVVRIITVRGLERGPDQDFTIVKVLRADDGTPLPINERPFAITKHSARPMRLLGTPSV